MQKAYTPKLFFRKKKNGNLGERPFLKREDGKGPPLGAEKGPTDSSNVPAKAFL